MQKLTTIVPVRICFVLLFCYLSQAVMATNYYVNDNSTTGDSWCTAVGNNANNGTAVNTPKRNVSNIISSYALTAGDVVYIDKGSYSEQITLTSTDDGSGGSYVTFRGAGTSNTTITYNSYQTVYLNGTGALVQYIKFQDMTIANTSTGTNYDLPLWLYGNCDYNVFDNLTLTSSGATSNVVVMNGDNDNNEFSNCSMTSSGTSGGDYYVLWVLSHASYGGFSNNSVHDCTIHYTGSSANAVVFFWERAGFTSDSNHFYNNSVESDDTGTDEITLANITSSNVYNNQSWGGRYAIYVYGDASYSAGHSIYCNFFASSQSCIYSTYAQDIDCYHNSVYTGRYGIYSLTADGLKGWNIKNNSLYTTGNSSYAGMNLPTATTSNYPISCDYNLYYLPGGAYYAYKNGSSYSTMANWRATDHVNGAASGDENSVSGNPNYSNTATGNLTITTGSAANNKGTTVASVTTDINGTTWGTYRNIGAYEDAGALPIVLKKFSVKCNEDAGIGIDWSTVSEINCDYFTVEKSNDGIHATPVQQVKGAVNSNQERHYQITDDSYASEEQTTYYRLTQTDLDGTVTTYNWVPVQCDLTNNFSLEFYPNPAQDQLTCQVQSSKQEVATITIQNILGERIYFNDQALQKGTNLLNLDIANFVPGTYVLQLTRSSKTYAHKFIKL